MATDHKTVADEIADRNPRSFEARWRMRVHRIADQPIWTHPLARVVAAVGAALLLALVVSVPLDLTGQLIFSAGSFGAALLLSRTPGRLTTLAMIVLSISASSRYMYWRVTDTVGFTNWVDACFGFGLLLAELYAFLVLLIGYFQTAWPLQRRPVPMPQDVDTWPSVDVFIPTYNEPLEVVKQTVFSAMQMDWPGDRLHVYVLDDGRREEFRDFCQELGVGYLTRDNNAHAKAGNINAALAVTDSEYVTIFDCDHIPTRSFLQICMGWFIRDPKLAMLQTPHHFFSPDPFEKNLDTFHAMPNEGELFYGIVQDGNDLWNAAFFCGSCAVIKRAPLLEIGGVAVETVTEDAHTALKLSRHGYNTAYLALPQAAGLATESLSAHVGQRIRWARGMAQICRVDNPLFGPGLKLGQRLCYFNAMLHFFYGLPRLVFLTAPLAYLLFSAHVFQATAAMITAYALPHMMHASITNSRIQGRFRYSFWNEVYESVLAWYIMRPVLVAFVNPKLGKFNVTDKGGLNAKEYFDWDIAQPYLYLMGLSLLGFAAGIFRYFWVPNTDADTVALNLAWTIYNVMMLGASIAVANEAKQVRTSHRVTMKLTAALRTRTGRSFICNTTDYSDGGVGLELPEPVDLKVGESARLALFRGEEEYEFEAKITMARGNRIGLRFEAMNTQKAIELVQCTFARADSWVVWGDKRKPDKPLTSLKEILFLGFSGLAILGKSMRQSAKDKLAVKLAALRTASETESPAK